MSNVEPSERTIPWTNPASGQCVDARPPDIYLYARDFPWSGIIVATRKLAEAWQNFARWNAVQPLPDSSSPIQGHNLVVPFHEVRVATRELDDQLGPVFTERDAGRAWQTHGDNVPEALELLERVTKLRLDSIPSMRDAEPQALSWLQTAMAELNSALIMLISLSFDPEIAANGPMFTSKSATEMKQAGVNSATSGRMSLPVFGSLPALGTDSLGQQIMLHQRRTAEAAAAAAEADRQRAELALREARFKLMYGHLPPRAPGEPDESDAALGLTQAADGDAVHSIDFRSTRNAEAPNQLVTLKQMAAIVNRTKSAVEKIKDKLPSPRVNGGSGKPSEWRWADVRPILAEHFSRPDLPEMWPADQFRRR